MSIVGSRASGCVPAKFWRNSDPAPLGLTSDQQSISVVVLPSSKSAQVANLELARLQEMLTHVSRPVCCETQI